MEPFFNCAWPRATEAIDHVERISGLSRVEVCLELQRHFFDGKVRTRGPIIGAGADPIYQEFWRFTTPTINGNAFVLQGCTHLDWYEVNARDLIAIWPGGLAAVPEIRRVRGTRGPRISVGPRVETEMRNLDRSFLESMKEEEMASKFNASRDTCRKMREKILAE